MPGLVPGSTFWRRKARKTWIGRDEKGVYAGLRRVMPVMTKIESFFGVL